MGARGGVGCAIVASVIAVGFTSCTASLWTYLDDSNGFLNLEDQIVSRLTDDASQGFDAQRVNAQLGEIHQSPNGELRYVITAHSPGTERDCVSVAAEYLDGRRSAQMNVCAGYQFGARVDEIDMSDAPSIVEGEAARARLLRTTALTAPAAE
ncbi:MAG: hypothetical protein AB7G06_09000 [Bdellovibrionales bacterium]